MPSAKGGDRRRWDRIEKRDLTGPDYSSETYKPRLQRRRMEELIGGLETRLWEQAQYRWRKQWNARPYVTTPYHT